jgi:predicted secreted protein
MTAFLLKEQITDNVYATIAGLKIETQDINDGHLNIAAEGIFTGNAAEQTAIDRALARNARPYELSFETGNRVRGKFRIASLFYRGTNNGERRYQIFLASVGRVETVQ